MSIYRPETSESLAKQVAEMKQRACKIVGRGKDDEVMDQISTERLAGVRFFDVDDMVIGVEAGMAYGELHRLLAEKNMVLPVNPWYEGVSVGAAAARAESGPDRLDRGGFRDFVIGMEYVSGLGELLRAGGKVVKNVSGYDVPRLLLGSRGGLACMTALHFKAAPKPLDPRVCAARADDPAMLEPLAQLYLSGLPIDWVQVIFHQGSIRLGIGFSGNEARRTRMSRELQAMFPALGEPLDEAGCRGDFQPFSERARFGGFISPWLPESGYHVRCVFPTRRLLSWREGLARWSAQGRTVILHPFGGDFHITGPADDLDALLTELEEEQGGYVFVERPQGVYPRLALPRESVLMLSLKRAFDPNNIFYSPFFAELGRSKP